MNRALEHFDKVFAGAEDQIKWSQGFDDCVLGKPNTSNDDEYNAGYALAYELGEKQSGGNN